MNSKKDFLNIVYICTAEKGASGGAKIIYDHCKQINDLNLENISSEILHIKKKKTSKWKSSFKKILKFEENNKFSGWKSSDITIDKNFKPSWFKSKIRVRKKFFFDKKKDFIIFPEIFAHFAKKFCIDKKIPYAIFAMNGYALNPTNDYDNLENSYNSAKFILTVSKDITDCLKISFPECKNKIKKVSLSIDHNKFNKKIKKTNLITYMPRKMPEHSETVMFFLRKHLPKNWKIKKIHNLKEEKVFYYLLKSKIFLSFTKSEGLGMPPIEAAIAGNKVIGYTGEGGKEIWHKPIFTEIPHGNVIKFVDEIVKNTRLRLSVVKASHQRKKLIEKFSKKEEKNKLIKMINAIKLRR